MATTIQMLAPQEEPLKQAEIIVAIIGFLLAFGASQASGFLVNLDMPEARRFPFIAPWVNVLIAALNVMPGIVIGWFAIRNPFLIAASVGFLVGALDTALLWSGVAEMQQDQVNGTNGMPGPGGIDYLASGVAQSIYLSAFAAVGVVFRHRVKR
ncbi:hypothetical protein [Marinobacter sp. LN3S78]|uniref:hypothetical protein n=1 Tax=Marinobacter sp. LN3S78 TaxID=3382300 RepID=UPI00387AB68B